MKKIQLACMVTFLAVGVAHASVPCDGFQIIVKNNLQDKLISTSGKLRGAEIQPGMVTIDSKSEQVFTVSGSAADRPMSGKFIFQTVSLPTRTVQIEYDLSNQLLVCSHTNKDVPNDYSVTSLRLPGKVTYTIDN